jgi:hypothetical protein
MSNELNIRETFELGQPYYGIDDSVSKTKLKMLVEGAEQASLAVHDALYHGHLPVVVFDDVHSQEKDKFISLCDKDSKPCYGRWDEDYPATDIGLRGINLNFKGTASPTTIIHADSLAPSEFGAKGAPKILIEALDAIAKLHDFVIQDMARPMFQQIAETYGVDPRPYIETFFPSDGRRMRSLTRAIMYHAEVLAEMRPVGNDDKPLLIKQHKDQSSFTIDNGQTSPGLEYLVDGEWVPAHTSVACFRGTADDNMKEEMKPTVHRVVYDEEIAKRVTKEMARVGIIRAAFPTFIASSIDGARAVKPSSPETHPEIQSALYNVA